MKSTMKSAEEMFYKKLGELIQSKRNVAKLSQEELATKLGIKRTSLTNIESGNQTTQAFIVFRLASALKIPVQDLFPDFSNQGLDDLEAFLDRPVAAAETGQMVNLNKKEKDTVLKLIKKDSQIAKRKKNHG